MVRSRWASSIGRTYQEDVLACVSGCRLRVAPGRFGVFIFFQGRTRFEVDIGF